MDHPFMTAMHNPFSTATHTEGHGGTNSNLAADYFVAVEGSNSSWAWRIQRKSRPLGVKIIGDPVRTEQAARIAGERALTDFLERLSQEVERQ